MKSLIVNADDFGKDENSSFAIAESFRKGFVTRTTLMVNMPWADRAVDLARQNGFLDKIGLHLNLISGMPLTSEIRPISLFCDDDGCFNGGVVKNKRYFFSYTSKCYDALEIEIEAQIKKYLSYELPLLHCDSHCHSHFRLPILRILLPLLRKYGFRSIRSPYSIGQGYDFYGMMKRVRGVLFRNAAHCSGLNMTDEFGDWESYVKNKHRLTGTIEVMVHPFFYSGQLVDMRDYETGAGRPLDEIKEVLG